MTIQTQNQDELDDHIDELRRKWEQSRPRFTDAFLFEAFYDAIDSFPEMIAELNEKCQAYKAEIKRLIDSACDKDETTRMFVEEYVKRFLVTKLMDVESAIDGMQRLIRMKHPQSSPPARGCSPADVQRAREISIVSVAERIIGPLHKSGTRFNTTCPFHQDKTPSFFLYPESERYYCFGCHVAGDTIALVSKVLNLNFPSAINYLINQ